MTKSKSPSLASVQGTRPPSGRRLILGFRINETPRKNLISEPAVGFRMETILLAFSFLSFPLLSKIPALRAFFLRKTCFIASKKDYITFLIFLSIPFPSFFSTFFQAFQEGSFLSAALFRGATEHNISHSQKSVNMPCRFFFSFFSESQQLCCGAFQRQRIRNIQQHFYFVKQKF